jgi:hypothetical protein
MARWILTRLGAVALASALAGWLAAPTLAAWRLNSTNAASIAYNQGIAFDQRLGGFFFDGVSSIFNSGLYRTDSSLTQRAGTFAVIPSTVEGYNHLGDLSVDPTGRRVLLPLECFYPNSGGNTCGTGAIGVANPATLQFRYYVNLDRPQIQKAMWAEIDPDGRWIWTSSGHHLLAFSAADVSQATARRQRTGEAGGIVGKDLGAVLPTSEVTGAAFYEDSLTRVPRLLLSLNRGTYFEVVSFATGIAQDGAPTLLATSPTSEITLARSSLDDEPEGLTVTSSATGSAPLGGLLHWQTLPASKFYTRILNYLPA